MKTKMDRALWCVTTQHYERSRLELASEKLGAVACSLGELVAALAEIARLEEGVKLGIDDAPPLYLGGTAGPTGRPRAATDLIS
tara:strand:- start:1 stop:252 length:252 start_codon:yes stop_codon:yes gene_type:complete